MQPFVVHGILVCQPDRAVSLGNEAFRWFALDWLASKRMNDRLCEIYGWGYGCATCVGIPVVRHALVCVVDQAPHGSV